jgi:hypothetical protein
MHPKAVSFVTLWMLICFSIMNLSSGECSNSNVPSAEIIIIENDKNLNNQSSNSRLLSRIASQRRLSRAEFPALDVDFSTNPIPQSTEPTWSDKIQNAAQNVWNSATGMFNRRVGDNSGSDQEPMIESDDSVGSKEDSTHSEASGNGATQGENSTSEQVSQNEPPVAKEDQVAVVKIDNLGDMVVDDDPAEHSESDTATDDDPVVEDQEIKPEPAKPSKKAQTKPKPSRTNPHSSGRNPKPKPGTTRPPGPRGPRGGAQRDPQGRFADFESDSTGGTEHGDPSRTGVGRSRPPCPKKPARRPSRTDETDIGVNGDDGPPSRIPTKRPPHRPSKPGRLPVHPSEPDPESGGGDEDSVSRPRKPIAPSVNKPASPASGSLSARRKEVLRKAKQWTDAQVPYSQTGTYVIKYFPIFYARYLLFTHQLSGQGMATGGTAAD